MRFRTDPFHLQSKNTNFGQEVLAGLVGWQAVASSVVFYPILLLGDDDEGIDVDGTVEIYLLVAGLSTMAFGFAFNVPFIVAPSVLYAARESGVSIGGHMAAQAAANVAAALFFFLTLRLSVVSYIPTPLRLGAGCGISMLVSIFGMQNLGLLSGSSPGLQHFTWQSVVGLIIVSAACLKASPAKYKAKWAFVLASPMVVNSLVYALTDRSKFGGYSSIDRFPLTNWGKASLGAVDFSDLSAAPLRTLLYIIEVFFSVVINVASILLVLIDAVCLEKMHTKVKSSAEIDFSNAVGGTKKFRAMATAVPLMSLLGNLVGTTTQAAFVESMILVFAAGKTGLSAVVTGGALILTIFLRPILPILSPDHVAGALTVVISLRFFSVIRMIDVTRPSNLLMFGIPLLLVPISFNFVDSVCIAAVLGFICELGDKIILRGGPFHRGGSRRHKVAVSIEGDQTEKGLTGVSEWASGIDLSTSSRSVVRDRGIKKKNIFPAPVSPVLEPSPHRRADTAELAENDALSAGQACPPGGRGRGRGCGGGRINRCTGASASMQSSKGNSVVLAKRDFAEGAATAAAGRPSNSSITAMTRFASGEGKKGSTGTLEGNTVGSGKGGTAGAGREGAGLMWLVGPTNLHWGIVVLALAELVFAGIKGSFDKA